MVNRLSIKIKKLKYSLKTLNSFWNELMKDQVVGKVKAYQAFDFQLV